MKQFCFITSLLLLVISPSIAAQSATPVSLLGVTLGKTFTLVGCQRVVVAPCASGLGTTIDYGPPSKPIYHFTVYNRYDETPDFVEGRTFIVDVIDDKIERISITTTGNDSQQAALQQLTEKFGKPKSIIQKIAQNRMGAKLPYIVANWEIGDVAISFEGMTGRLDEGRITATTARYTRELLLQYQLSGATKKHL